MAVQNDFAVFARGSAANLEALSAYLADSAILNGEQPGIANSARANRAWRQATSGAAGLAQFCANQGVAMPDDGDINAFATRVATAIGNLAGAAGGAGKVNRSGDTMTGALTVPSLTVQGGSQVPTNSAGSGGTTIASQAYADASASSAASGAASGKVNRSGDTMSGTLNVGTGTAGAGGPAAASQSYADTSSSNASAGKVNRSGDTMTGGLTAPSLTSTGDATANRSVTPTVTSPSGQSLLLQAGGTTYAELDTDGFARLSTLLPRTANDTRAARTDYVKGVGQRFNGTYYYPGVPALLTTAMQGGLVYVESAAAFALPKITDCEVGGAIAIANCSGLQIQVNTQNSSIGDNYGTTISFSSLIVPDKGVLIVSPDQYWRIVVDPRASNGKLTLINSVSISSGTTQVDTTWTAGAYERVLIEVDGLAGTGNGSTISIRRADGTWSPAVVLTNGLPTVYAAVTFLGAQFDNSQYIGGGGANSSAQDPGILGQGQLAKHSGGLTGVRISGNTFSSGALRAYAS